MRNSKLLLLFVVVITFWNISMSSVVTNLFAVTPSLITNPELNALVADKLLVALPCSITTLPVPDAVNVTLPLPFLTSVLSSNVKLPKLVCLSTVKFVTEALPVIFLMPL